VSAVTLEQLPVLCRLIELRLNYTWINHDRKSVHLPAPTYIDYVMTWVQNLLDDENTFPTKSGDYRPPSSLLSFLSSNARANQAKTFRRPSLLP
jgi:hypothetical protein